MTSTSSDPFEKTLQTTHVWLDDVVADIGVDRRLAWHLLGVVLRRLRDRLPLEVAVHLGAQLPLLIRGTYFEQWHLGGQGTPPHRYEEFVEAVADHLSQNDMVDPEDATAAVLRCLVRHVDAGQIEKALGALPKPIRDAFRAVAA